MPRWIVSVEEVYHYEYEIKADDEQSARERAYDQWAAEEDSYNVDEVRTYARLQE